MNNFKVSGIVQITVLIIGGGALVHAQSTTPICSASLSTPLEAFVGVWGFSTDGSTLSAQPFVSAGVFVASIGTDSAGNRIGVLAITATSSNNGQITRLERDAGSFQVNPDCSGGTLVFNLSSHPFAFDFWFAGGTSRIVFTSNTSQNVISGSGGRSDCVWGCVCIAGPGCPCCGYQLELPTIGVSLTPMLVKSAIPRLQSPSTVGPAPSAVGEFALPLPGTLQLGGYKRETAVAARETSTTATVSK
jgi:hypothetical protein